MVTMATRSESTTQLKCDPWTLNVQILEKECLKEKLPKKWPKARGSRSSVFSILAQLGRFGSFGLFADLEILCLTYRAMKIPAGTII